MTRDYIRQLQLYDTNVLLYFKGIFFKGKYIKLDINALCFYLLFKYKVKPKYKVNPNKISTPIKLNNIKKDRIAHYNLHHIRCAYFGKMLEKNKTTKSAPWMEIK